MMSRFHYNSLLAIAGLLLFSALCPGAIGTTCRIAEDDRRSVYAPDNASPAADRFRVTRIVGLGTADRYVQGGALDGTLVAGLAAYESGVLSPDGCVSFYVIVNVPKEYYSFVQLVYDQYGTDLPIAFASGITAGAVPLAFQDGLIYQGGIPKSLPLRIRVTFNGSLILDQTRPIPIRDTGYTERFNFRVPIRAASIKFARHLPSRGGGPCPTAVGEENCPGLNQLNFTYSLPPSFTKLGLNAGFGVITRGEALSFSAMAPIYLATGCCGERQNPFWDNVAGVQNTTLAHAFRLANLPFYLPDQTESLNQALTGTIRSGALQLPAKLQLYSKIFGSKWLHFVGHSKGGLNGRQLLGEYLAEKSGLGIRTIVTINTPHLGSLGGDLSQWSRWGIPPQFDEGPIDNYILEQVLKKQIAADARFYTQSDLTQSALRDFNADPHFSAPPKTTRVGTVARPILARTIVTDANLDASQENQDTTDGLGGGSGNVISYVTRTINANEVLGLSEDSVLLGTAGQLMYNLLGKSTKVTHTRSLLGAPVVAPVISGRPFLFNDIVVTVNSQSYAGQASTGQNIFAPLNGTVSSSAIQPVVPRGVAGANHNSVPNGAIGSVLAAFYRNLQ